MEDGKSYVYGDETSKNVVIQMVDQHDFDLMNSELRHISDMLESDDFCIVAVKVNDWNSDLSPWKAAPVFGNHEFGDGAKQTLDFILRAIVKNDNKNYYLCGYSLAGLFSLWAGYQTDIFKGIIAISPSVWYKNWMEYIKDHNIKSSSVYLSLGDKEEKTKNQTMKTVGDCINNQYNILKESDIDVCLEWNPGNHFVESDKRIAKGVAWMLKNL